MRGMRFPIDIIWIHDGEVVGIEKNIPVPLNYRDSLKEINSPSEVNLVLEVNAGFCEKYGIKKGASFFIN